jgi:hypothetical protein
MSQIRWFAGKFRRLPRGPTLRGRLRAKARGQNLPCQSQTRPVLSALPNRSLRTPPLPGDWQGKRTATARCAAGRPSRPGELHRRAGAAARRSQPPWPPPLWRPATPAPQVPAATSISHDRRCLSPPPLYPAALSPASVEPTAGCKKPAAASPFPSSPFLSMLGFQHNLISCIFPWLRKGVDKGEKVFPSCRKSRKIQGLGYFTWQTFIQSDLSSLSLIWVFLSCACKISKKEAY